VAQALQNTHRANVIQVTIDGNVDSVKRIPNGLSEDTTQNTSKGRLPCSRMVKVLQRKNVPPQVFIPIKTIDETNAQQYLEANGRY
jgi:ABC-type sugar transport system substrate-binding protein